MDSPELFKVVLLGYASQRLEVAVQTLMRDDDMTNIYRAQGRAQEQMAFNSFVQDIVNALGDDA